MTSSGQSAPSRSPLPRTASARLSQRRGGPIPLTGDEVPDDHTDYVLQVYRGEKFAPHVQRVLRDRIHWLCSQARGERILDVGCSQGITSLLLAEVGKEVTGIDPDIQAIEVAQQERRELPPEVQEHLHFLHTTLEEFVRLEPKKFNSIIIGEVLEHLTDPTLFISQATDLLLPGGQLIITTPYGLKPSPDHRYTFTFAAFLDCLPEHLTLSSISAEDGFIRFVGERLDAELSPHRTLQSLPSSEQLLEIAEEGALDAQAYLYEHLEYYQRKTARLAKTEKALKKAQQELKEQQEELNSLRTEVEQQSQDLEQKTHLLTEQRKHLSEFQREREEQQGSFAELARHLLETRSALRSLEQQLVEGESTATPDGGGVEKSVDIIKGVARPFRNLLRHQKRKQEQKRIFGDRPLTATLLEAELKRILSSSSSSHEVIRRVDEASLLAYLPGNNPSDSIGEKEVLSLVLNLLTPLWKEDTVYEEYCTHTALRLLELAPTRRQPLEVLKWASESTTLPAIVREKATLLWLALKNGFPAVEKKSTPKKVSPGSPEEDIAASYAEIARVRSSSLSAAYNLAKKLFQRAASERSALLCDELGRLSGEVSDRKQYAEYLHKEHDMSAPLELCEMQLELLEHGYHYSRDPNRPLPSFRGVPFSPQTRPVLFVVHATEPFTVNGYATRSRALIEALHRQGENVEVVLRLNYPQQQQIAAHEDSLSVVQDGDFHWYKRNGVRYWILPKPEAHTLSLSAFGTKYLDAYTDALVSLIELLQPKLIHGASSHVNGLATASAAEECGIPSLYEMRGFWELTRTAREPEFEKSELYALQRKLDTDAAQLASGVVVLSNAAKEEMVSRGISAEKIQVVRNGASLPEAAHDASPPPPHLEERLSTIPVGAVPILGYVGSLVPYEGLELLLRACGELRDRGVPFHLVIVGGGSSAEQLKAITEELQLSQQVTLAGKVSLQEVKYFHRIIDIYPFPRTGTKVCELVPPLKPYEAIANRKCIVASDVQALQEMISHGENGLLFQSDSLEALTNSLEQVLTDRTLREHLQEKAFQWFRGEGTWDIRAESLARVYEHLTTKRHTEKER
ncbi:glycosyltransferase [bacterium]|nr:glycosyltransferase [bacterium]